MTSLPSAAAQAVPAPGREPVPVARCMLSISGGGWHPLNKSLFFFSPFPSVLNDARAAPGSSIALQRKAWARRGCSCLVYFCHPLDVSSCADFKEVVTEIGFSFKERSEAAHPQLVASSGRGGGRQGWGWAPKPRSGPGDCWKSRMEESGVKGF